MGRGTRQETINILKAQWDSQQTRLARKETYDRDKRNKMIAPMVLLDLIIEAQRFTTLSGSLKRAYVFDQLGPLSEEERLFISLLIDAFLMLCKKKVAFRIFSAVVDCNFALRPLEG